MRVYAALDRVFRRSYALKMFAVAFVGTHLPLLVLVGWILVHGWRSTPLLGEIALLTLAATLVGTVLTLYLLHRLLHPVRAAAQALDDYERNGTLPMLPTLGVDDASRLMAGVNRTLHSVEHGKRELERVALCDSLTGVYNRRGCEQRLQASLAAVARGDIPALCLLVVDMDDLKQINDQYGHAAGDRALAALAGEIRGVVSDDEWVGRWGGDEFLAGLHRTADAFARQLARWHAGIAQHAPLLRASIGVAQWREGEDVLALSRRADEAMYRAKLDGGHRIVIARE